MIDLRPRWLRELSAYHRHLSWTEFWVRYAVARMRSKETEPGPDASDVDARRWYASNEFLLLRQAYYHRKSRWPAILRALPDHGSVLEYGCGIAPVSAWLADRTCRSRPGTSPYVLDRFVFTLVDLPSPALNYAAWRMKRRTAMTKLLVPGLGDDLPYLPQQDVIVCLEVLEHVPNPATVLRYLVSRLKSGGTLFVNFIAGPPSGMNLRVAQEQRKEALAALQLLRCERPLTEDGQTGVYCA